MSVDLQVVAQTSRCLQDAYAALASEQVVLASLEMKNGQDFSTNLMVCGKKFQLVAMGRNYYPERIKALDVIRLELIKYQQGIVQFHKDTVEGLEFKLQQVARSA